MIPRIKFISSEPLTDLSKYESCIIIYPDHWNDMGYFTTFNIKYVNHGVENIGQIKLCHMDLKIDVNNLKSRRTSSFLFEKSDEIELDENELDENKSLDELYISIGSMNLYNKLNDIFDKDHVQKFLCCINEVSTIEDNKSITRIINKDWYKKSFIRVFNGTENEKTVNFTLLKNNCKIEDNSYYVLQNLIEFNDKLFTQEKKLYKWVVENDLVVDDARKVVELIKKFDEINKPSSNGDMRNKVLKMLKEKFIEYTELTSLIDSMLDFNSSFYRVYNQIINILQIKEKDSIRTKNSIDKIKLGHYTSLETLQILINDKESSTLRLTNARQMNDPMEGKILIDSILKHKISGQTWEPSFWYISSATTEMDSLPMWKQYGEDATGAMLVYDSEYLKSIQENKYVQIYKVAYLYIKDNMIKVVKTKDITIQDKKKLENLLKELKDIVNKEEDKNDTKLNIPLLSNLGFLFKKSDYSYENEYRIIVNMEQNKEYKITSSFNKKYGFPFLYIHLEGYPLKYSRVILGPKSIDLDFVAPFINNCDGSIKIDKSNISYR